MCTAQVCTSILSGAQPYRLLFAFPTLILIVACNQHAVYSLAHTVEHAGVLCAQACTICTWNPSDIVCVAGMLGSFASTSLRTHPELLVLPGPHCFYSLPGPHRSYSLPGPHRPHSLPAFHHLYTLSGPHYFYSLPGSHCLNTVSGPHRLTHMPSLTSWLERCLKVRHCNRQRQNRPMHLQPKAVCCISFSYLRVKCCSPGWQQVVPFL